MVPGYHRQRDDLRHLIRMQGTDRLFELMKARQRCLDDQQNLAAALHPSLPPEHGFNMRKEIHTGCEMMLEQMSTDPTRHGVRRARDEDHHISFRG